MKKKFVSFALTLSLMLGMVSPALAAFTPGTIKGSTGEYGEEPANVTSFTAARNNSDPEYPVVTFTASGTVKAIGDYAERPVSLDIRKVADDSWIANGASEAALGSSGNNEEFTVSVSSDDLESVSANTEYYALIYASGADAPYVTRINFMLNSNLAVMSGWNTILETPSGATAALSKVDGAQGKTLVNKTAFSVVFTATASQGNTLGTGRYQLDSAASWADVTANPAGTYTVPLTGLSQGEHTLKFYATETGKTAMPTNEAKIATATFTVDTVKPTVSGFKNGQNTTNAPTIGTIVLTLSEPCTTASGITGLTLTASGKTTVNATAAVSGSELTVSYSDRLSSGTEYTVNIPAGKFTDTAGNSNVASNTFRFTTVGATQNTGTCAPYSATVQYGDTVTLTVNNGNNSSPITWPANGTNLKKTGGSGNTATYQVLASTGTMSVTATQAAIAGNGPTEPVAGKDYTFSITAAPKEINLSTVTVINRANITATKTYDATPNGANVTVGANVVVNGATINGSTQQLELKLKAPLSVNYTGADSAWTATSNYLYSIPAADLSLAAHSNGGDPANYTLTGTFNGTNGAITPVTPTIDPVVAQQVKYSADALIVPLNITGAGTNATWLPIDNAANAISSTKTDNNSIISSVTARRNGNQFELVIVPVNNVSKINKTATVKVSTKAVAGKLNVSNEVTFNVTVIEKETLAVTVPTTTTVTYDGAEHAFFPVEVKANGSSLTRGSGYTVSYKRNETPISSTPKDAGTYTVVITPADTANYAEYKYNVTIDRKEISAQLQGLTFSKPYDGNTTAIKPADTLNTGVGSEALTLTALTGTYNNKNAAESNPVTITAVTLTDNEAAKAANYTISGKNCASGSPVNGLSLSPTNAKITQKPLELTVTATKEYNGSNDLTGVTLSNLTLTAETETAYVQGESIALGHLTLTGGTFVNKDVHALDAAATNVVTGPAFTFGESAGVAANYNITWTVKTVVTVKTISNLEINAESGLITKTGAASLKEASSYLKSTDLASADSFTALYGNPGEYDAANKQFLFDTAGSDLTVKLFKLVDGVKLADPAVETGWDSFKKADASAAATAADVLTELTTAPGEGTTYYVLISATTGALGTNYTVNSAITAGDAATYASYTKFKVNQTPSSNTTVSTGETIKGESQNGNETQSIKFDAKVSKDGKADLTIKDTQMEKVSGKLTFDLSGLKKEVTGVGIPAKAVTKLAEQADSLALNLTNAAVTFDKDVLATVAEQGGDVTVKLEEKPKEELPTAAKALVVGNSPVYELTFKAGGNDLHELGGRATVELPYKLNAGEDPRFLVTWRLVNGQPQPLNCSYDPATGKVAFDTDRFSFYTIAYFPFTDVATSSWYYAAAANAYKTGLMNGMGDYLFEPNFKLSRPMLVTMLYSAEGKPAVSMSNPFSDLSDNAWYRDPVLWAAESKIVNGYYYNVFGVDDAVTREQIALILYNYAKQKGYDVAARADLSSFADEESIRSYAVEALRWANANGLINGRDDGTLDPQGAASRAEVATIMYAFAQKFVH